MTIEAHHKNPAVGSGHSLIDRLEFQFIYALAFVPLLVATVVKRCRWPGRTDSTGGFLRSLLSDARDGAQLCARVAFLG